MISCQSSQELCRGQSHLKQTWTCERSSSWSSRTRTNCARQASGTISINWDGNRDGTTLFTNSHNDFIPVHHGMSTINLMVNLWREQPDICWWKMVGYTRQVDVISCNVDKLNLVDFCYVTNVNITLSIVDEVATKRCQPRRPTGVPNKNQCLGIDMVGDWLMHLISTTK